MCEIKYVSAEIDKRENLYEKGSVFLEKEYYNVCVIIDNVPHFVSYVISWWCGSQNMESTIDFQRMMKDI